MSHAFITMDGIGNDFIIFDGRKHSIRFTAGELKSMADRSTGIGCDQIIIMEPSQKADVFMRIYNADGSEVSSCGNATRCVAWLLMQESDSKEVTVETKGGVLRCISAGSMRISVDMGQPRYDWREIPLAKEYDTLKLDIGEGMLSSPSAVSMGNPHMVFVVDDVESVPLEVLGPKLEHHPLFPERANVSIAQVKDRNHVSLRVWERGAGLTLACGTAACATFAILHKRGLVDDTVSIALPGGTLHVALDKAGHIIMTGNVAVNFKGVLP